MKNIILLILLIFSIGCNSSIYEVYDYEPEFSGQLVDSEIKVEASYYMSKEYYQLNDSFFYSVFKPGYYLTKPISEKTKIDSVGFLIKPFPEDTLPVKHIRYRHYKNQSNRLIPGMKVTLINNTSDTLILQNQDGSMIMIQEAKGPNGKWQPIEYWISSFCGNAYGRTYFLPFTSIDIPAFRYAGTFNTLLRFKLEFFNEHPKNSKYEKKIIYSEPFEGSVNYSQFQKIKTDTYKGYLE